MQFEDHPSGLGVKLGLLVLLILLVAVVDSLL
jgi:hypothetical protein